MPKFFPPTDVFKASAVILSVDNQFKQNELSFLLLCQMLIEEKDVGDENNIREACNKIDVDFDKLL